MNENLQQVKYSIFIFIFILQKMDLAIQHQKNSKSRFFFPVLGILRFPNRILTEFSIFTAQKDRKKKKSFAKHEYSKTFLFSFFLFILHGSLNKREKILHLAVEKNVKKINR
jgi:hypothetical protein